MIPSRVVSSHSLHDVLDAHLSTKSERTREEVKPFANNRLVNFVRVIATRDGEIGVCAGFE